MTGSDIPTEDDIAESTPAPWIMAMKLGKNAERLEWGSTKQIAEAKRFLSRSSLTGPLQALNHFMWSVWHVKQPIVKMIPCFREAGFEMQRLLSIDRIVRLDLDFRKYQKSWIDEQKVYKDIAQELKKREKKSKMSKRKLGRLKDRLEVSELKKIAVRRAMASNRLLRGELEKEIHARGQALEGMAVNRQWAQESLGSGQRNYWGYFPLQ